MELRGKLCLFILAVVISVGTIATVCYLNNSFTLISQGTLPKGAQFTPLWATPINTSTQQNKLYPNYIVQPAILGRLKKEPVHNPYGGRGNVFRTNSKLMYPKPYTIGDP